MNVIIMDLGDDVKGESSAPGWEKKIDVLSYTLGDAIGRDSRDMIVSKYVDTATPQLHRAALEGKVFPQVDVILGRNDEGRVAVMLRYIMKNVLISSIRVDGGGGDKPIEKLTLNYNTISWDYPRPGM